MQGPVGKARSDSTSRRPCSASPAPVSANSVPSVNSPPARRAGR